MHLLELKKHGVESWTGCGPDGSCSERIYPKLSCFSFELWFDESIMKLLSHECARCLPWVSGMGNEYV